MYRIGFAKDIHKLIEGRPLLLGGVEVPFNKGELAHSDGDVVLHAVAESMLGALALGDLGKHFPDTSDATLNMKSTLIVEQVLAMVKGKGFKVNNIDVSIIIERPKLKDYISSMQESIARLLEVSKDQVSVKACTNEGMGELGRNEAVEADAIVLLERY